VKVIAYLSARRETATPVVRAVKDAAAACDLRFARFGETFGSPPLPADSLAFLGSADLVVAHVSHLNSNLLFEIGVAHGLGKPIIVVAPTRLILPIDLRGQRTVTYETQPEVAKLAFALKEWIKELDRKTDPHKLKEMPASITGSQRFQFSFSPEEFEHEVAKALATVPGWEVLESSIEERNSTFDFVIWNKQADSTLAALGNPIAVEVKTKTPPTDTVRRLAETAKKQGLGAVLFIVGNPLTKSARRSIGSVGNRAGVIALALDHADLESIESGDDFPRMLRQSLIDLRLN
jgi:hypothetical protein